MDEAQLNASLKSLQAYIEREQYKGYDPYDTLNSFLPFTALGKFPAAVAIQLQKRKPVNIRPLLGIKKAYNPKAMGLFLEAFCLQYKCSPSQELKSKIDFLFSWLIENQTENYSGICWGYNFGWANPQKYLPPFSPTVVVSGFIARAIYQHHQLFSTQQSVKVLESIANFVLNDIPVTETENGICFSYSTQMKECCYNASLLAAEILLYAYSVSKKEELLDKATAAVDFVLSRQQQNGCWNYSINMETGQERKQIDFHQGYVLDSIQNFIGIAKPNNPKYARAIEKGMAYYHTQFFDDGRCKWRIPKEYPIDIHNQAQGIISFSKFKHLNAGYLPFAQKIACWTIENMQHKNGYFYYRKYKLFTNKIAYIRWAQAWMLLALTKLKAAW